MLDTIESDF